MGGVADTVNSGTIDGLTGTVTATAGDTYVAGVAGTATSLNIYDAHLTVDLAGSSYVGGLIGKSVNGNTIEDSEVDGTLSASANYVGGIVGAGDHFNVRRCRVDVDISGSEAGGIVGSVWQSTIDDSYVFGSVTGGYDVGGLVGRGGQTNISRSYSTAADDDGGFMATKNNDNLNGCFWDTEASGIAVSDGGTGLTTAQSITQSSYTGFGFGGTWNMIDGVTYPCLSWEASCESP